MIVFENVKYKNFLSSGNSWTEIKLNDNQNTLIIGSNGSGKSTVVDAICFSLFNKAFRNINKGQLVNSINQKVVVWKLILEFQIKLIELFVASNQIYLKSMKMIS